MATEVTEQRQTTTGTVPRRQISELIEATIDTDANGDGSITVDLHGGAGQRFVGVPWVTLDETSPDAATVENVSADSLDITVTGSGTTGGTVTVRALVYGRQE